jgi:hypothetical protein
MKVYTSSGWIAASSASVATLATFEFVATSGQTVFTGADANGATLSYVAPALIVTLNGVRLRPGDDYTATNGTSITLVSAAALNDELVVDAFGSFLVANAVDLTTTQTIGGTKTFSNPITASAGTVSAPGITTTGDSNTGIFFPAADTIAFTEGGTEVMRIDSAGNVGIGTNNPATKLEVWGATSYAGINTTVLLKDTTAMAANTGAFVQFSGNYTTVGDQAVYGGIGAFKENGTSGQYGGYLALHTRTHGNLPAERMRINSAGHITTPYQPGFCAHEDGNSSYGANATMVFNVVKFNTGSHYNSSNGRFTAPIAGKYIFYAQFLGEASANTRTIAYLSLNGSQGSSDQTIEISATTKDYNSAQGTTIMDLAAGDYVSVITAGTSNVYTGSSFQNNFCGYLLG